MTNSTYRNIILLVLCVTAGIVDVIGYLSLGHIFTANMTGNIVLLGLAIGNSLETTVFHSLTALGGFIVGVVGAAILVGNKEKTFWPKAVTIALGEGPQHKDLRGAHLELLQDLLIFFHVMYVSVRG